jgi:hypothetical protein
LAAIICTCPLLANLKFPGLARQSKTWPECPFFRVGIGTPVDALVGEPILSNPNHPGNVMINGDHSLGLKVGGIAFLAGIIATLITTYAVVSRKRNPALAIRPEYGGYDGDLGI